MPTGQVPDIHPSRMPRQDLRLRMILVSRTLHIAWVNDPRAPWRRLVTAAVELGAQYDPPVSRAELGALKHKTIGELFDPAVPRRQPTRTQLANLGKSGTRRRPDVR